MPTQTILPQETAKQPRFKSRHDRAKVLGSALGYTLSENIDAPGVFYVRKPGAQKPYTVDADRETCSCPATVQDCAHLLFVKQCLRRIAYVDGLRRAVDWATVDLEAARERGSLVYEMETALYVAMWRLAEVVGGSAWRVTP